MPFSNLWDQTFPPDTQQASQGGSDLRQLRVDTQQRMAVISGLDASKPAFGSDVQPAAWNGILFFATDTGKIYQWNNPSWTNITGSFYTGGPSKYTATGGSTNAGGQNLYSVTVPSGFLRIGSDVRIMASWNTGAAGATVNLVLSGTSVAGIATPASISAVVISVDVVLSTNTNAVVSISQTVNNTAGSQFSAGITVPDVTVNNFTIVLQQNGAGATSGNNFSAIVNA